MNHPSLYQINTRVVLFERGLELGRPATLDDVTDPFLDRIAAGGFQWVWMLGVWQTGPAGQAVSRSRPELLEGCRRTLPDLREEDVCGSPFSIQKYEVHRDFGGDAALNRLRQRLARRHLKLLLDFVPNHTALDHPWVATHPEYYVHGRAEDLRQHPENYRRLTVTRGDAILAYGRDPYFAGWPDTLQLNYFHAGLQEQQVEQVKAISERCDGVRCDMAMLVQPHIFRRTWGDSARPADGSPVFEEPFWPRAIGTIRRRQPGFLFVAEVYWDMEWELQQAGFDYTYDKRLYDRLHAAVAGPVRGHLSADPAFRDHSLRFLENHDEPRAAAAFPGAIHQAAAVVTYLAPGLRFFHDGQLEGRKVQVSMHVRRRPVEAVDDAVKAFYDRLLNCLRRPESHEGDWSLRDCREAWPGNQTHQQFIVSSWTARGTPAAVPCLLVAVNYGDTPGQCYVNLDMPALRGGSFTLVDLLSDTRYVREGDDLASKGLYLDMPPWGHHVFELRPS